MHSAKKPSVKLALLTALFALPLTVGAADASYDDSDMPDHAARNYGPLLVSGGVGDDEMAYIKQEQHKYSTKILFTAAGGEYLSDLKVGIADSRGNEVVSTVTKGPVLLVDLPAGNYQLTASRDGLPAKSLAIKVVGHVLHSYQLRFPTSGDTRE